MDGYDRAVDLMRSVGWIFPSGEYGAQQHVDIVPDAKRAQNRIYGFLFISFKHRADSCPFSRMPRTKPC